MKKYTRNNYSSTPTHIDIGTSIPSSVNFNDFKMSLPSNTFKKNDEVKFKYKGKIKTGKIIKLGAYGVDVRCGNQYFYCFDYNHKLFESSNITKNYK